MNGYIYIKNTENINDFSDVISIAGIQEDDIYVALESERAFRKLNDIKKKCSQNDMVFIRSLHSLGTNDAEMCTQLEWFISKPVMLSILSIPSTYEYGISQPANRAALSTILQSMLTWSRNVVPFTNDREINSGKRKLEFPHNWEEMYNQWQNKELSSKDFLKKSGLKKATFYNMITEYKLILEENEKYINKYKCI